MISTGCAFLCPTWDTVHAGLVVWTFAHGHCRLLFPKRAYDSVHLCYAELQDSRSREETGGLELSEQHSSTFNIILKRLTDMFWAL